jgi:lipopolysaccharide transport system permease protein
MIGEVAAIALGRFRRTWELLYLLTARELKLRYQDTVLGFVWSVIKPLLLGLVLYVILSHVAKIQTDIPLQLVILPALFPWSWFQTSAIMAAPAIANNGNLIKKVHFPRYVLPFSTVANNMVHFLLTIPIIMIFILASGRQPNYTWLIGIPVLMLVELMMLLGVVLFISAIDVYFRDLEHLLEVFLNLAFYMTPIIYPLSTLGKYQNVALLNPMASLIEAWRNLFVRNELPTPMDLWPCLAGMAAAVLIGSFVFGRLEKGFADAL